MPTPWLDASHEAGLAPLDAAVARVTPKLIVLDNLLLIKGGVDENSAEMGVVMAHLRQLTERYDCVVTPIHHQRKDQGAGARAGDRLRGHSSIEAALDLALLVERQEGSSEITLTSTKTRGADVAPFGALFTYEHQAATRELHTARFYGIQTHDLTSDHAIERTIRAVLTTHAPLLKMDLCGRVREALHGEVGTNRIRHLIDRLAARHRLLRCPGPKGGDYFSLASQGASQ